MFFSGGFGEKHASIVVGMKLELSSMLYRSEVPVLFLVFDWAWFSGSQPPEAAHMPWFVAFFPPLKLPIVGGISPIF